MSYDLVDAKPIHELCKIIDCEHKTAPYVKESEFLVVRTSNVRNGQLVMEDMKFTTEGGFEEWTQRAIPEYGDVLFTREAPAGESCLVPEDKKICMGQRMVLLRPNRKKVDPLFLSLILATEKCKFDIYRLSIGSTVSRINISDIKNLKVASPPLPEQQKIAQILSTWDQAILVTKKLLEKSQQQKKSLMQQLLTGKKRLLDENGVRFDKAWNKKKLREIGEIVGGLTYTPEDVTDNTGNLVLRSSNVQDGRLVFKDNVYVTCKLTDKTRTKLNDILICVRNGSRSLIGKSALLKGQGVDCFHGAFMTIFRTKEPFFIFQIMQSDLFFREVDKNLGATINSINGSDLRNFSFLIPSAKEERDAIASVLTAADLEIDILQKKLDCLQQEKKALMQQLLTGKKRVKVAA